MQQTKPDDPDAVDPDAIATQGVGVFFSRAVYSLSENVGSVSPSHIVGSTM